MLWLKEGWRVFESNMLEVFLAFLLVHLALGFAFALCFLPGLLIVGPAIGGLYVYLAKRSLGLPTSLEDVLKGRQRYLDTTLVAMALLLVPLILLALLVTPIVLGMIGMDRFAAGESWVAGGSCLILLLGLVFGLLYPIVAWTFLVFAYPLVMFKGRSAGQAISESIQLVKPRLPEMLMLSAAGLVLMIAAGGVGSLVIVGSLILSPIAHAILTGAHLAAFRDVVGLTTADLEPYR